jgi:imidazolonepropionase-like amidohydrolase
MLSGGVTYHSGIQPPDGPRRPRGKMKSFASYIAVAAVTMTAHAQQATVYERGRLIIGDGSAAIENGAFVVQSGHITEIGRAIKAPPSATHVNLAGKTVMPAMINVHVHIGYEKYTSWGAQNYTAENVLDHLQREAFYGTAATLSVGTSPIEASLQFQRDQQSGKFPPASQFLFIPGYAPPNGGPDAVLREATNRLHVINEVSTAQEARASIQKMADRGIKAVKIWLDDRRGTYPKMTPEVYNAIIDGAHKHGMIVHAHAMTLPDQKAVVGAGADVLVHLVQTEKLDEEFLALIREKKPYWATVIAEGDPTAVCEHDPFFEQAMPATLIAKIRATMERRPLAPSCGPLSPNAATREAIIEYNFPRMIAAGARIVLGTDTGIEPGHTFGSGEHVELARWVQLGLTPSQAITAATQRPAELLGIKDMGTLEVGKRANFIVLDANPLENIRNSRRISSVYLDGARFDREEMLARWKKMAAVQ